MDINYSNRELDQMFKAADERADAFHNKLMQRMDDFEVATTNNFEEVKQLQRYTNGRVRWNEKMIWLAVGFCGCLAVIVLPLAWALISSGKL